MFPGGTRFASYDHDEFCIEADFLVVDECSMIDTYHFQKLLDECSPSTRIVLVGDIDQLGPIAAGQPFADLIASELFPVTRLDRVFRFAEGGAIAEAARAINHGDVDAIVNGSLSDEFEFVSCADPLDAQHKICDLITRDLPANEIPTKNVQVLVPVHKGTCGRKELNKAIRAAFGRHDQIPAVGDRVIQTRNDPSRGVFNGQIGEIICADHKGISVLFDDVRRTIAYDTKSLSKRLDGPTNHLDWANAMTTHKAQGSEFEAVIVPVFNSYSVMLLRNLYYTAVSRGRKKVVVIGNPNALQRAARNLRGTHRITKLAEFLNPDLDWPSRAPDMGAVSYLELERAENSSEQADREAEEYVAALQAQQERLIAKFEAGEATHEEIEELIKAGILVPADPA
jgi:exodeoxyribonuclease V alpha subunit